MRYSRRIFLITYPDAPLELGFLLCHRLGIPGPNFNILGAKV